MNAISIATAGWPERDFPFGETFYCGGNFDPHRRRASMFWDCSPRDAVIGVKHVPIGYWAVGVYDEKARGYRIEAILPNDAQTIAIQKFGSIDAAAMALAQRFAASKPNDSWAQWCAGFIGRDHQDIRSIAAAFRFEINDNNTTIF